MNEIALAKKRSILRRYLAILGVTIENELSLSALQSLVRVMHTNRGEIRHAWPLTSIGIDNLARENHYVKNLLAMKQIWGLQSSLGVVHEEKSIQCHTVADLVNIGWASSRFLAIDANIERLDLNRCNPKTPA